MTIDAYLKARADRCPGCGYHVDLQACACAGLQAKERGQAIATAAHPDDRARVDAAIRAAANIGRPFSANSIRSQHGVVGGVVGAAFTAARKAGLIQRVGREASTSAATHGHEIGSWVGVQTNRSAA